MESDSDHFESADEEFASDDEENPTKNVSVKHSSSVKQVESALEVRNITLEDTNCEIKPTIKTLDTDVKNNGNEQIVKDTESKKHPNTQNVENEPLEKNTGDGDDNNANNTTTQKQKPRVIERKERPQKSKEAKPKLGVKLGTNSNSKNDIFWEKFSEAKKNEYADPPQIEQCWEDGVNNWPPPKPDNHPQQYSEKSKLSPDKNFWESEEDYMELPKDKNEPTNSETNKEQAGGGWGGWGNWGVTSLLSTASHSVSTLTNSVSQGITTVLESGIGVPDPEELARIHKESEIKGNDDENKEKEQPQQQPEQHSSQTGPIGFGIGNFVSGVTHITKLVETTGTKVLTGGLDTLEVIGKKTMEVLQEGDPGLKKKRALFKIENKTVLSQMLREAKEKAEEEDKFLEQKHIARKPHYETIFDDCQGLVHLEALEMLSKQCDIKLETLLETLKGSALTDMQETMSQIKELCELPGEEDDNVNVDIESVREKIATAVSEMNIEINYENFLRTWTEIEEWLQKTTNDNRNEDDVHQKTIESLAHLTANAVEQFHKAGELLLIKERRSTVDEADSLVQLTVVLTGVISAIATKFSEKLNSLAESNSKSDNDTIAKMITDIFLEAANSSSYIQDAFNLMVPVLQVGAV